jgi:hypothetical protein
MMMLYQIKTTTHEDHLALLHLLYNAGFRYSAHDTVQKVEDDFGPFEYPFILIYDDKSLGGNYRYNDKSGEELEYPQDITKILNHVYDIKVSAIKVKDVGTYDGVVTKNVVKVGCQTISYEKIQEIATAVKQIRK